MADIASGALEVLSADEVRATDGAADDVSGATGHVHLHPHHRPGA